MIRYALMAVATVCAGIVAVIGLTLYALRTDVPVVTYEKGTQTPLMDEVQAESQDVEYILFGTSSFQMELADTHTTCVRGLSGRSHLAPKTGLFFAFPNDDMHGIWMKDMRFPIDIIWLDSGLRVVHIESDVSPDSFPASFVPTVPARFVFEINAGEARTADIAVGSQALVTQK